MAAELSGILNWCLEGAREVMAAGRLFESMAMKRLFEAVKRDSNPAQQFVEECVEVVEGELEYDSVIVSGSEMHLAYTNFCHSNGYHPLGRNKMINEVKKLGLSYFDTTKSCSGAPTKRFKGFLCTLRDLNSGFKSEVVDFNTKKR